MGNWRRPDPPSSGAIGSDLFSGRPADVSASNPYGYAGGRRRSLGEASLAAFSVHSKSKAPQRHRIKPAPGASALRRAWHRFGNSFSRTQCRAGGIFSLVGHTASNARATGASRESYCTAAACFRVILPFDLACSNACRSVPFGSEPSSHTSRIVRRALALGHRIEIPAQVQIYSRSEGAEFLEPAPRDEMLTARSYQGGKGSRR
jgi:hypothetical protein